MIPFLSDFLQGIIIVVAINIIAVLGVSILTGFTRLFSFGNAAFMAIGAYASAILTTRLQWPFVPALLAGIFLPGLAAWLLGSLTLRLKGDYFLITTLGFGECVRVLFEYLPGWTGGAQGMVGIPHRTGLFSALFSLVLALIIAARLVYSRFGRALEALREEELAAESVGINATGTKKFAFTVSAAFAGWAGALWAHHICFIAPAMFNLAKSAELTITVVIGGLGSLSGSVLGSLLVNLLPEIFRGLANFRIFLYGAAVVLVIILRPDGLLGYREISPAGIRNFLRRGLKRKGEGRVRAGVPRGGDTGEKEDGKGGHAPLSAAQGAALPPIRGAPPPVTPPDHRPFTGRPAASGGNTAGTTPPSPPILEIRGLGKNFGGVRAIDGFDLSLARGSIHGLIGPNGAGKTTVFNTLTGLSAPGSGSVFFEGREITGLPPHRVAALGIGRTFQNIRLFGNLGSLENIVIAGSAAQNYSLPEAILRLPRYGREERELRERARSLLEAVGLSGLAARPLRAASLPYGHQRRLEIARALALKPKLLLLDEPAAGMNAAESRELALFVRAIRERFGLSILMIEHHIDVITELCDRVTVLNFGRTVAEGSAEEVKRDPLVIDAYLGSAGGA